MRQPSDDCWSVEMQYLYRCQQYKPYLSLNDKIIRLNIIVIKSFLLVAAWRDLSISGELRVSFIWLFSTVCVFTQKSCVFSNVKYVQFQNFHQAPAWPDLTMGRIGGSAESGCVHSHRGHTTDLSLILIKLSHGLNLNLKLNLNSKLNFTLIV